MTDTKKKRARFIPLRCFMCGSDLEGRRKVSIWTNIVGIDKYEDAWACPECARNLDDDYEEEFDDFEEKDADV